MIAMAQVYGEEQTATESSTEENNLDNTSTSPSHGTVPGIYYDPEPGLSPSLSEMSGTDGSGSITTEYESPDYNVQRAWQRGSTPDQIIKVGDLENDPELEGVIDIENLTLREIAANGGADIEQTPLKSIGLVNSMTLDEFLTVFPELENSPIRENPVILESINRISKTSENLELDTEEPLDDSERNLLEEINEDPILKNIPLKQILNGDLNGVVYEQVAKLVERYPELENVPIEEILNGDLDEYLQERGELLVENTKERLLEEVAKDPLLKNAPLEELLEGNFEGAIDRVTREQIARLVERYPELENVPIEEILNGDLDEYIEEQKNRIIDEAKERLLEEVAKDPLLKNVPLEELLEGDVNGAIDSFKKEQIAKLIERYPLLENVPIEEILNGDLDEYIEEQKNRIIDEAKERLLEEVAKDPLLKNVPLEEILDGDFEGAVERATKEQVAKLVERYPLLENVPIEEIINGDLDKYIEEQKQRILTEAQKRLIEELGNNPIFENIPLDALVNGDWEELLSQGEQAILAEVMEQFPDLEQVPIDKLFPIVGGVISGDWSLLVQEAKEVAIEKGTEILTKELLQLVPELADVPLGALPIEELLVGDIEGLADAALDRIPAIANRYLSELGNLSQTPGTMLAIDTAMILLTGDVFGRLDIPYAGDVETPITYVLSGGTKNQVFLPEPCLERDCKHFEVVDILSGLPGMVNGLGKVQGKAWVQGSSQSVPGGKGFLRWVNGGRERTGVPVWTTDSHVKLSLENIDEGGNGEPATARIWLNFQICIYPPFLGEHCTPHFLSFATPWKVREGGVMVVFSRSSPSDWVEYGRDRASDTRNSTSEESDRSGN